MENNRKEFRPAAASIGRRLKEAREKKSLTIEQIQKQTKIHSTVLVALEEGRASEILTDTYVRSFLKKYSQFLGLTASEILKEYFPPHDEALIPNVPIDNSPMPEETKVGPKVLYFTLIALLGVIALFVIFIIGSKVVTYVGRAKAGIQQKAPVRTAQTKKKTVKSVKSPQKKQPASTNSASSKDIIPKSAQLSLVIKVKEPVLVTVSRDGVRMFSRVLTKDVVENVTANESIELEINKAKALDLSLNGNVIALPEKNRVYSLVITRKGVKIK